METFVVFTALTRVGAGSNLVHGQTDGLVCLFRQRTETHGSSHKMLHDVLDGLHLVDADGIALESEEIADEDGRFLLVNQSGKLFELRIVACVGRQLQRGNGLGVPGVLDAVLAVVELTQVGQEIKVEALRIGVFRIGHVVEADGITGDGLQTDTTNGAGLCAEIVAEQTLGEADALENLGTAVGADGGDTHLGHNLEQTLLHGLDVVGLGSGIVFLNLVTVHQVVEDGEGHVRTEGRGSVAEQQGCMHGLTYLTALDNQSGLDALAY